MLISNSIYLFILNLHSNEYNMNLFCLLEWFVPEKGLEIMFNGQVLIGCPSKT